MTAPTTGEREPDALLLMRKQTKRLTAWRQCDDAQAIRSAEHVVCSFYAKDLAEVVSHVDAIRADLARVTAERDEDRRDYAADTAMAVACIEALREVQPGWERLFYATEESKMEDCAAFTIRQLAEQLATAQREAAALRECHWRYMDWPASDSDFETECGQAWSFNDGGITENGVVFCHHCGGKVIAPEIPNSCIDCGDEISALAERCTPCAEAFTPAPEAGR